DDDEGDADVPEKAPEAPLEPLGRDVDELELPRAQAADTVAPLLELERRVDNGGAKAVPHERVHLILHERDERAHDERRPGQDAGGDLERERLAGARRHDADAVPSPEHGRDDLLLARTEIVEAEDTRQDVTRVETGMEVELLDGDRIAGMPRRTNLRARN